MTTVLCGTDFSEHAAGATRVAAGFAARLGLPLRLVHVAEPGPWASRLGEEAARLEEEFGIRVEGSVEPGVPDEVLVSVADRLDSRLIVVGSLGARKQHRWVLGSVAERVAQTSSAPVLVVRDGARIEAWTRGEAPLRVLVGVETTPVSRTALDWALGLRSIGPVEIVLARIAWPIGEHERFGIPPPIPLDRLRPELERALLDELGSWTGLEPDPGISLVARAGWGRADEHLAQLAEESKADLLVVGTNRRAIVARFWQGSVSRGVLHCSPVNVACVPTRPAGGTRTP